MIVLEHIVGIGLFGGASVDVEIPIGEILSARVEPRGLTVVVLADDLRPAFLRWTVYAVAPGIAYPGLAPNAELLAYSEEFDLYVFRQPAP